MIRISTDKSEMSRLVVEGHLSGSALDELREACISAGGNGTVLDLSGVMFADRRAAMLLRELRDTGFVLERCSGFIRELMREALQTGSRIKDDEAHLIERLRAGDNDAFELLVLKYGGRMLGAAQRILQSESDARDAVQEALLSVFKSIANFAGEAALATWLHRIVVNAALMQMRSRRRRAEESIENLLPQFDESGGWAEESCPSTQVADLQESRERLSLVRKCLDQLPDRYRIVLLLRDIEDLDTQQTARMLNVTTTAVKVRLHRARQALKALIERQAKAVDVRADAA